MSEYILLLQCIDNRDIDKLLRDKLLGPVYIPIEAEHSRYRLCEPTLRYGVRLRGRSSVLPLKLIPLPLSHKEGWCQ